LAELVAVKLSKDLSMSGKETSQEQVDLVTRQAKKALDENEAARGEAWDSCGCKDKTGPAKICATLGEDALDYITPTQEKGQGKDQPKTGK
jgi:hypothetical protein